MRTWTGEALRSAALAELGAFGDTRARDALLHASVEVTPGVARWEASSGPVEGHRVTLALEPARLEAIRAAPAIEDSLRAALAAAVATHPGESLFELTLRPLHLDETSETPYRGRRPAG
jgi:hypothetical protein